MENTELLTSSGVNLTKSLEIFGDIQTYNESLGDFYVEVFGKLKKIEEYKEKNDMENYAILVHSLKSDAKYFGFEKLAELAYNHEMESKANNKYYVSEHYNELVNEANRIINLVKRYLDSNQKEPSTVKEEVIQEKINDDRQTIIVADDSDIIKKFITRIFGDKYNVLVASDGNETINLIKQYGTANYVGFLLDLNMPGSDGFTVLDYFKENDLFKKIPVVIITGNNDKTIDEKAFAYPIIDILKKPFDERDVRALLDKLIAVHNKNN